MDTMRDRYRKERVRYRDNLFMDLIERETCTILSNPKILIDCETGIVPAKTSRKYLEKEGIHHE